MSQEGPILVIINASKEEKEEKPKKMSFIKHD